MLGIARENARVERGGERMTHIENGRIDSTMLGIEENGILSTMIGIECPNYHQGFGGYCLDTNQYDDDNNYKGRVGTAYGMEFINRILKTLKVNKWESLIGTPVRVMRDEARGPIIAIGHFINDEWFDPQIDLKEFELTDKVKT